MHSAPTKMDIPPSAASPRSARNSDGAPAPAQSVTERFTCQYAGCTKAFSRKTHLIRHAQSHFDSTRHVCRVCLREFTRNDSLQRHLVRHGGSFKPSPSTRSKRACVACHASKVKCDGRKECLTCKKRSIECIYNQEVRKDSYLNKFPAEDLNPEPPDSVSGQPADDSGWYHSPIPPDQEQTSTEGTMVPPVQPKIGSGSQGGSRIDWVLSARIEKDTTSGSSRFEDDQPPSFSDYLVKRYTKVYFTHFHHRWPIFHAPTYEADGSTVLWSSVLMIGSWFNDTQESKIAALEMHGRLTDLLLLWLNQTCSSDRFQERLPAHICQAALLNVIFGLQCGRETTLSKAAILRSTLVTALREVGLFTPEIPYDKPAAFAAFRRVKTDERKRMAAYLYKIDSYISILRCEPPVLMPEELYFSLPSTFALYNGLGLHVWEIRQSIEPEIRTKSTIRDVIQSIAPDSAMPADGLMLIEDIQLGLCGLQPSIWHLSDQLRRNLDTNTTIQRSYIRARLESWKNLLLRLPFSQSDPINFTPDQRKAMRFYCGLEDHSEPGWQSTIFARPTSLFFDALMLYHLLSIHLNADIRILRQLTQDTSRSDFFKVYGSPYEEDKLSRESGATGWAQTEYARRGLCHATAVLALYNNLPEPGNKMVDPIAFVALSTGALVVWAYCTFGAVGCDICRRERRVDEGLIKIDLMKWAEAQHDVVLAKEKEAWIDGGGGRLALDGTEVCRCHMENLISKFQSRLPEGWQASRYEMVLA